MTDTEPDQHRSATHDEADRSTEIRFPYQRIPNSRVREETSTPILLAGVHERRVLAE